MGDWHNRPAARLMKELDSGPSGLMSREAEKRLEQYGPNELDAPKGQPMLLRVL